MKAGEKVGKPLQAPPAGIKVASRSAQESTTQKQISHASSVHPRPSHTAAAEQPLHTKINNKKPDKNLYNMRKGGVSLQMPIWPAVKEGEDLSKREKIKGWFRGRKTHEERSRKSSKKEELATALCRTAQNSTTREAPSQRPPTSSRDPTDGSPHCTDPVAPANLHSRREREREGEDPGEANLRGKEWSVCMCFFTGCWWGGFGSGQVG
jgi:hypothetical protein